LGLEINPYHPLIVNLKNETDDQKLAEWANLLFEQALVAEGGQLDDHASFVRRMNKLLLDQ
jgi:molecular chaperone HtpG